MPKPLIPIILLAAGASSRMRGRDKLMMRIDGDPLIRRSTRAALATGQPVLVATPPAPHDRIAAIADLPVRVVDVPDASEGMNASLRRVLAALPDGADAVMVLLADLPEIEASHLDLVLQAYDSAEEILIWRGSDAAGKPGHPVLFDKSLFGALLALTGDGGAQTVVAANRDRVRLVPLPGTAATLDLDTPEDWDAWKSTRQTPQT